MSRIFDAPRKLILLITSINIEICTTIPSTTANVFVNVNI